MRHHPDINAMVEPGAELAAENERLKRALAEHTEENLRLHARITELEKRPAPDYWGQCAPKDATARERVEAAAALLCLPDPAQLLEALFDAGLKLEVKP